MNEPSHQSPRRRNCNPELRRDHDRAYRERNAERIKELRKNWNSRYRARQQGDEMRARHCANCGQTFTPQPGRPEQEYCRAPCTPRLVIERERAEAAAARERERGGAQPPVRSALWKRLNERVC